MKHDVNIILLGLVLFLVVSMIALVVYYRITYEQLNEDYRTKKTELQNLTYSLNSTMMRVQARDEELARIEKQLRDFADQLNLSKTRESALGEHFTELKGEKGELSDDLNKTMTERARYEKLYNQYYTDYRVCKQDYEHKVTELTNANNRMNTMISQAAQIDEKAYYLDTRINSIPDKLSAIYKKADDIDDLAGGIANKSIKGDIEDSARDIKSLRGEVNDVVTSIEGTSNAIATLAAAIKNG
ncbi:MAG: hypothetical protein ABIH11_04935 [Candidatus Altiarchaeota archaeon]